MNEKINKLSTKHYIRSKKIFFYPNAGFSLLSHFIGLFLIIFTQVLGSFSVTKLLGNLNAVCFFIYPTKKSLLKRVQIHKNAGKPKHLCELKDFSEEQQTV